jgi:hypothetical protein
VEKKNNAGQKILHDLPKEKAGCRWLQAARLDARLALRGLLELSQRQPLSKQKENYL